MKTSVPVLMYHKVGAEGQRFLNVGARDFARQMRLLKRMGYQAVTFAAVIQGLFHGEPLPYRPVCITFDDGYCNVFDHAAPVLQSLGWAATVFVPTAYVGGANTWDRQEGKPVLPIMGWTQLRALTDRGWELAGHTHSHVRLDLLEDDLARKEIADGCEALREGAGAMVSTFCYPFGRYNERTPRLVLDLGLQGACTTRSGLARASSSPALLPRVKIAYRDRLPGFLYRLLIRCRAP